MDNPAYQLPVSFSHIRIRNERYAFKGSCRLAETLSRTFARFYEKGAPFHTVFFYYYFPSLILFAVRKEGCPSSFSLSLDWIYPLYSMQVLSEKKSIPVIVHLVSKKKIAFCVLFGKSTMNALLLTIN
jgi:hypothetical protein